MRTSVFEENGSKHLTVLSFQAIDEICEKYKDLDTLYKLLTEGTMMEQFKLSAETLVILMKSGDAYAKEMGLENAKPLTVEQIYTRCSPEDLPSMVIAIKDCFSKSMRREINIATDPNAETTQA